MVRKLFSFALTLLGFSAVFVFESCYGPVPKNYDPDEIDSAYDTRCDTIPEVAADVEELVVE